MLTSSPFIHYTPSIPTFPSISKCLITLPTLSLSLLSYPSPFLLSQCVQDQCIQSTKFVLQAAATPLMQSEPVILTNEASLPGRTSLGGPCSGALPLGGQPTPPTSTPNLSCDNGMLPLRNDHSEALHHHTDGVHHHFLTPEEAPSPPGMLPCGSPLGHSHTIQGFYNPASQDSLHEDSVRGLVKLSSV